jgi:alpha-tubulin suppressor-like RCC1 family protein
MGNGTRSAYVDSANWTTVKGLNSPALNIDAGGSQTCALLENGSIACWGLNGLGQLGDGLRNNSVSAVATGWWKPFPIAQPGYGVQAISVGWAHTCALKNNQVKCWGSNFNAQVGLPASTTPQKLPIIVNGFMPGNIVSLVSGNLHSCVLFDTGKVQCWGENQQGQLGNGSITQSPIPVTVQLSSTDVAKSIIAAGDYSCAILQNETAKCWGSNSHGQLGAALPMNTYSTVPVAVSGLNGVTQLSAKMVHTCALLRDGTTKCWGANYVGQLGNSSTTNTNAPVNNALWINDVVKISVGSENSCALRTSGTVWCWGRVASDGANTIVNYPVNIAYLNKVTDISAGNGITCVRMENGTLKCFGYGGIAAGGGKDLPSTGNSLLPNSVRYLSAPASSVALSRYMHACAILVTGEVSCWGSNYAGQLGNDSLVDSSKPVLVQNL